MINTTNPSGKPGQAPTANAGNQISTTGYTYDGAGNLTADPSGSYVYTGAEQMKTVTKAGTTYNYQYAGAGQQEVVEQQSTEGTIDLVYGRTNAQGLPVVESAKVGSVTAYVENDPFTGQPLMLKTSTGSQSLYVYTGQGSPVALLRDNGSSSYSYKYDPYGVASISSDSGDGGKAQNPFLFAGGIQDRATGWVKYGARWYNPAVGRWTQQDTMDTPLDPANANRYAYAGDDPINNLDPLGTVNYLRNILNGFFQALAGAPVALIAEIICVGLATGLTIGSAGIGAPTYILCGLLATALGTTFGSLVKGPF